MKEVCNLTKETLLRKRNTEDITFNTPPDVSKKPIYFHLAHDTDMFNYCKYDDSQNPTLVSFFSDCSALRFGETVGGFCTCDFCDITNL